MFGTMVLRKSNPFVTSAAPSDTALDAVTSGGESAVGTAISGSSNGADKVPVDGAPAAAASARGSSVVIAEAPSAEAPSEEAPAAAAANAAAEPSGDYDAFLLAGFGGPRVPEDVVPFLRNVTAGRGIPDSRLEEVGEHYYLFGGRSPINDQVEALRDALTEALRSEGIDLPVVVGNRNWDPYTEDALRDLAESGARRILTVITAAYSSYSGCRQYREDIDAQTGKVNGALASGGADGSSDVTVPLQIDKVRAYFNTQGFVDANIDAVVDAFGSLGDQGPEADLVFVTHSIPTTMERASGAARPATYAEQHHEVARLVAAGAEERLGRELPWRLVYCSRSGAPHVPWLEPDVNDELEAMAAAGSTAVVLSPIGFISDHMEVVYDLDTEARATAERVGLGFARAATAGTHPRFLDGLVQVVKERMGAAEPSVCGDLPAWGATCAPDCCFRTFNNEGIERPKAPTATGVGGSR